MRRVTLVVGIGTPEQAAFRRWLGRWQSFMRQILGDEGCRRCVEIYFVETLPDVLAELPAGVIVVDGWPAISDLETRYCRCPQPNLSETERRLLDNALDAHDRLWDGETSVVDLWALYAATAEALHDTPHRAVFDTAVTALASLMQSGLSADIQRDQALGSTDDLRYWVARQLRSELQARSPDVTPGT